MKKEWILFLVAFFTISGVKAQDSLVVKAHAGYDSVTSFHRLFFGENYRKEWAAPVKLPVIRISEISGGLIPTQRGGGHQSLSLRLVDVQGKEWVLRTVRKYPEVLLPENLRGTFAKKWLEDNMSAQHPYSALIVPPVAKAAGIPYTNPIIGIVADEKQLGEFAADFANVLCLIEEREPLGESDNTLKMLENINGDNDHSVDGEMFLRCTIVDIIIGDWDRHIDQWRWSFVKDTVKGKYYTPVPRDRDQVFYVNQGLLPKVVAFPWNLAFLEGFDGKVRNINTYVWESRVMAARVLNGIDHVRWMEISKEVQRAVTDSVLWEAIGRLPGSSFHLRSEKLFSDMKSRRDNLLAEMEEYYRFLNKVVDIRASDKRESVIIRDTEGKQLKVDVAKGSGRDKKLLLSRVFDPQVTKEIRIFLAGGKDSISIENNSGIKLRVTGGEGHDAYSIRNSNRRPVMYDEHSGTSFYENKASFRKVLSADSLINSIIPTNRYNITSPLVSLERNPDDGFLFGLGIKYINQGFRKHPYGNIHQIYLSHAFSTSAYKLRYNGEWLHALRNTDIVVAGFLNAPNNTMNYFGRGNESINIQAQVDASYYRARFNLYQLDQSFRWRVKRATFSAGPSIQYYRLNLSENTGRYILQPGVIGSYDGGSVTRKRLHAGLIVGFQSDRRNNSLIPSSGHFLATKVQAYTGLNSSSRTFVQAFPEVRFYKSLTADSAVVIAERIGGGITFGKAAFYQSVFLGGQDNLRGFRQSRFNGSNMIYNNIEMRIRLTYLKSYILPGELGITCFYDAGRVWVKEENSDVLHHGVGGSLYFSPVRHTIVQASAAYSTEGWFPTFNLGFRF